MFSKLIKRSFVPQAILQPHTGGQQLKLIVMAPSCLLQLSTEDVGFPEVCFVSQRLAAYGQQVGATGSPLHSCIYPHHSTETFVQRAQRPPDFQGYWISSWLYFIQPLSNPGQLEPVILKPGLSRFPKYGTP